MNLLSVDTSTKKLSLAITKDGRLCRFCSETLSTKLSSVIMPRILKICRDSKITLDQIDAFAVGIGPGSFTSLRVGLSTVKGLVFGNEKKIVGISSLDILALNTLHDHTRVTVIGDARRGMVYFAQYDKNGESLKQVDSYQLMAVEELKMNALADSVVIGDGIPLVYDHFKKDRSIIWEKEENWFPQAKRLALLASPLLMNNKGIKASRLLPLYLYAQDCQVRK